MGRRFDLDDESSDDSLEDVMRDLERKAPGSEEADSARPETDPEEAKRRFEEEREAEHRRSEDEIQDALERIGRDQREAAKRRPRRAAASPVRWIIVGVIAVGAIVGIVIVLLPSPPPSPAFSPEGAVESFWNSLVEGDYEAATAYYPSLVERFGGRKQAALHLRDMFGDNPPVKVLTIGEAEALAAPGDLRVAYEVMLRTGRPRSGEFIVRASELGDGSYVIITAP